MKTRWMPAAFALAGLIALTGLTGSAKAGLTVNGEKYYWLDPSGPDGINDPNSFDLEAHINANPAYENVNVNVGSLLWKWDRDDNEITSDGFAYTASGNGKSVTISIGGAGYIVNTQGPAWLVVKDGESGHIVFDLSQNSQAGSFDASSHRYESYTSADLGESTSFLANWDGVSDLTVTWEGLIATDKDGDYEFKNGELHRREISNVQLWGTGFDDPPSGTPPILIPEPATSIVWLISACLCGLFIHRRVRRLRVA